MPKQLEFEFRTDGSVVGIYDDSVPELMKDVGQVSNVDRASTVEWETRKDTPEIGGWVVRSAVNPTVRLAMYNGNIEVVKEPRGGTLYFASREKALEEEVKRFWFLLSGKETV